MKRAWYRAIALAGVVFCLLDGPSVAGAQPQAHRVLVEPRESDELFANPGIGWQTLQRFADQDKRLQGLPSASMYFQLYWRELEPRTGQIDFAKFDALLAHARRAGKKLAFRLICTGSGMYLGVPAWLKEQGGQRVEFISSLLHTFPPVQLKRGL